MSNSETLVDSKDSPLCLTVDVIIPTWNRGDLLSRAVRSALHQGPHVRRILVVDNGTTPAKLDATIDSRIQIISSRPCIGASGARNLGVSIATSDIVAFLDDDDYWEMGYLASAVPLFKQGADIVVGKLLRMDDGGQPRDYKLLDDSCAGLRRVYYRNPGIGGQNILVRRRFFHAVQGFDATMPASNDRDFAARALQAGAVIRVQPAARAVLCDHGGPRVRHNQVKGNYRFIRKHWKHMMWSERAFACYILMARVIRMHLRSIGKMVESNNR